MHENYPCLIPDSTRAKGNKVNRCLECSPCSYWNVISYFNQKTVDVLVKCTRLSLDFLRKSMQQVSRYNIVNEDVLMSSNRRAAFFNAKIILELPQIVMKPSLDDIQHILNKSVQLLLKTCLNVHEWKHHGILHQVAQQSVEDSNKGNVV